MNKSRSLALVFTNILSVCSGILYSSALAQALSTSAQPSDLKDQLKGWIMLVFLGSLFICFLVCLYIILWGKDKDKVIFATDAIKSLTAFFTGALTGYLG
jgi:predicted membrane channel-forming protein YqfA (hemolysin III family)